MIQTMPVKEAAGRLEELVLHLQPGDEIKLTSQEKAVARIVAEPARRAGPPYRGAGSCKGMLIENPDVPDDIHLEDFKDYM